MVDDNKSLLRTHTMPIPQTINQHYSLHYWANHNQGCHRTDSLNCCVIINLPMWLIVCLWECWANRGLAVTVWHFLNCLVCAERKRFVFSYLFTLYFRVTSSKWNIFKWNRLRPHEEPCHDSRHPPPSLLFVKPMIICGKCFSVQATS